jgi:teichoic acid glycerol-phosphate primase
MNYGGLIYDDSLHYLDHLAPLCSLLKCPLYIHEPHIAELAEKFYPDLLIKEGAPPSYVISCYTRLPKVQNIWLPHGASDKGWKSCAFKALKGEKYALIYGEKMLKTIQESNAHPEVSFVGNFRLHYFLKHKAFYEGLYNLPKGKKLLYAPTWEDSENNSTFWTSFPKLAENIEERLLVKLHPNTIRKFEPEIERLKGRYPHVHFLDNIPPIYPLLAKCDGYIGDMSSIGYDFLFFDRPMFFLNHLDLPLQQCGVHVKPEKFTFSPQPHLSLLRKNLYERTYSPIAGNMKTVCKSLRLWTEGRTSIS